MTLRCFALFASLLVAACGDDGSTSGGGGSASSASGDGGDLSGQTSTPSSSGSNTGASSGATSTSGESVASSSASTGGGAIACSGADPSFSADVQPILTASCALNNCHRGSNPDKDLDLSAGAAWAALVGVETVECGGDKTRVIASDPAMSYLVHKIRGEELCETSRRMPPPNRDPLSDEHIQIIVDWVCSGAADD